MPPRGLRDTKVAIVVRYDDFFIPDLKGRPLGEVRAAELALATFHADAAIPAVLAVVPAGLNGPTPQDQLIAAIRRACAEGSEVALHGYDHVNTLPPPKSAIRARWARFCRRTCGEFASLPAAEQMRRMVAGRHMLESCFLSPVRTFVPPWNAYDESTVAACRAAGLTAISASRSWPVPAAESMTMLPQTVGGDGLEAAVEHAIARRNRAVIVCVMHVFDFDATEGGPRIAVAHWASRLKLLQERSQVAFTTVAAIDGLFRAQLSDQRLRRHRRFSAAWRVAALLRCVQAQDPRRAVYLLD